MATEIIREALGWCAVINFGLLIWWLLILALARDWAYRLHSRYVPVTIEQFNGIHYAGVAMLKLAIFFFNVVPYIALRIVG